MISLHAFTEDLGGAAARLGGAMQCRPTEIAVHRFQDGETLPRVSDVATGAVIYRSLHDPNAKLIEVLLSADALRRAGAKRVVLAAPYVPYLRQDAVFRPGEPLSRDVIIRLLADAFDVIVTVDPHLHRTPRLTDPSNRAVWSVVSGAAVMANGLSADPRVADCVVGPDTESAQWAAIIAARLGLPHWTFEKVRRSDLFVELTAPDGAHVRGQRVLIVDDLCTSGGTLLAATAALTALGAARVEAAVTHVLIDDETSRALRDAGLARLRSCDGCQHPTNAFALAPALAAAIMKEIGT